MDEGQDPGTVEAPPPVILWFKIYAGALVLLYLGSAALLPLIMIKAPPDDGPGRGFWIAFGVGFGLLSLVLAAGCLLPLLVRPRPWVWIYDLVVICIGLTSACCLPVCIPLLIFWLKPEVKRWFAAAGA